MLVSSSQGPVNLSWSTTFPWKIKLWTIDLFLGFGYTLNYFVDSSAAVSLTAYSGAVFFVVF